MYRPLGVVTSTLHHNRTGLYAESHGIIANVRLSVPLLVEPRANLPQQNFWDPAQETEFHYNRIESCWQPQWWYGEPVSVPTPHHSQRFLTVTIDVGDCREGGCDHGQPHVVCTLTM